MKATSYVVATVGTVLMMMSVNAAASPATDAVDYFENDSVLQCVAEQQSLNYCVPVMLIYYRGPYQEQLDNWSSLVNDGGFWANCWSYNLGCAGSLQYYLYYGEVVDYFNYRIGIWEM
jgi:hypothetical protein